MAFVRLCTLAAFIVALVACSASKSSGGDTGAGNTGAGGGTTPYTPADSGTSTGPSVRAAWFALTGQLAVLDGALADETALTVRYYPEVVGSLDLPMCEASFQVTGSAAPSPDPSVDMLGWWSITLSEPTDCLGQPIPSPMALGIGPYDPLLDPSVARVGIDPISLNGLYAQVAPGTPLYVFGLIGTAQQYAATEDSIDLSPPPDGIYELLTLHLLPAAGR